MPGTGPRILLTGATGFIGQRLWGALDALGYRVRCASRDPAAARRRWPEREWVAIDVEEGASLTAAVEGCEAAYYLVHGMAGGGGDYQQLELAAAHRFREAAAAARLHRIVYLGGVAPRHEGSRHLESRLAVGAALRGGVVPAIELRASMVVGYGSLSWQIVRDLAARLPGMVLPRWLRSRTQPIAVDDVVLGLTRVLDLSATGPACYDLPGPETLSGEDILRRTAQLLGLRPPVMVHVPFLSPWLSSHWVRLVSRADWNVAREIVVGLKEDLVARDDVFWSLIAGPPRLGFADAGRRAIAEERGQPPPSGFWGAEERLVARLHRDRALA